jgi:hypothetical protein
VEYRNASDHVRKKGVDQDVVLGRRRAPILATHNEIDDCLPTKTGSPKTSVNFGNQVMTSMPMLDLLSSLLTEFSVFL